MASDNFKQWLEAGKALADEFASKKPSKKRKQKRTAGSSVSWRTRDCNGYIVPKSIQRNRSVKRTGMGEGNNAFPNAMEVPDVEDSQIGEIPQEIPNLGLQFLCASCDSIVYNKCIFYDREIMVDGFYKHIPPTLSVKMGERGRHELVEQEVCSCGCDQDLTIMPGKQTVLVTINGPYNLCLPAMGSICGDTFHRVMNHEFSFCSWKKEHLCLVEPFKCPACTPDMLAISADGNRKHYRFKKSLGTDEQPLFDGLFIAQDAKVSAFVDQIRSQMTISTQRAEAEAANLEHLQHELNIPQDDREKWLEDVKQWAATEKHGAHSSQEELQREIEDIIYSLKRKKHDLYRQNDSNQTRQRKRRRLGVLKKKLREMIAQYNTVAASEHGIDAEAVCCLSDDVVLPWEAQGDVVSLRLKRRFFDQVMLVRRMEEEKLILVKEMTQHYQYLRNALDKVETVLHHTAENITNNEERCTYSHVDTDPVFSFFDEDMEDCEEDDSSADLSEEEL
ncbi:uncharacterized protein V6R79_021868 [Siganus canaliculatus]